MTVSKGIGRGRKGIPRGPRSVVNGMKLCAGPLHEKPIWLPVDKFWKNENMSPGNTSYYSSRCKSCKAYSIRKTWNGNRGLVPTKLLWAALHELIMAYGPVKAAKNIGISQSSLYALYKQDRKFAKADTVAKIIAARDRKRHNGR